MSLFRAAARTMLASYFVVNGVKALRNPEPLVADAEPLVNTVVPLVKKYAPDEVSGKVPDDVATLVRIDGALQVIGGLALATGKGRRLGAAVLAVSLIPATIAKHPFWARDTLEERNADRAQFLKNVSLLGGVLLAARDTEGRPGLAWRAQKTQQSIARDTKRTSKKISKAGHDLGDQGRELAEGAIAGGTALIGTVVASTRKARKEAAKDLAHAQKVAAGAAKDAQKVATAAAKKAKKDAPKLAKQARKTAIATAKQAKKDAPKLAKQAAKQTEQARKNAIAAAKQAKKDAPKLAKQAERASRDAAKAARKAWDDRDKAIKQARKSGGAAIDQVIKDGGKLADQVKKDATNLASEVADQAQSAVGTAIEAVKDGAEKVTKNIHLGDN